MATSIDALALRKRLGPNSWEPPRPFGPDGWSLVRRDGAASIIVSCAEHDGVEWIHASIAPTDHLPTYGDLVELHAAVWQGRGFAYQVFANDERHVNIHPNALHLWGRLDGVNALPDFGALGTI